MAKLRNILDKLFSDTVRKEGFALFNDLAVDISGMGDGVIEAYVADGKLEHETSLKFDPDIFPVEMKCTCSDFKKEKCRHLAAVMYELNKSDFFLSSKHRARFEESLEDGTYFEEIYDGKVAEDGFDEEASDVFGDQPLGRQESLFDDSFGGLTKNFSPSKSRPSPKAQEQEKERKRREEERKFFEFKEQVGALLPAEKTLSSRTKYKIAYGIVTNYHPPHLIVFRQRLRKDGTVAEMTQAQSINFGTVEPPIPLEEKLIVDFILNHSYGFYDHRGAERNLKFGDIISFLSGKEVYLYNNYQLGKRISILKEKGLVNLIIEETDKNVILRLKVDLPGNPITERILMQEICDEPLWVMVQDRVVQLSNLNSQQFHAFAEEGGKIVIPKSYLEYFEEYILPSVVTDLPVISNCYAVEQITEAPKKKIFLEEEDSSLVIHLKFGYGDFDVPYSSTERASVLIKDKKILRIVRDKAFEESALNEIKSLYVKQSEEGIFYPRNNPIDFLLNALPTLTASGFEILGSADLSKFKVNASKPKISFVVSSGVDWFDLEAKVDFDGIGVALSELLASVRHKKQYIKLSDGSVGVLPTEWLNRLKQTISFGETIDGKIRFSKIQASALDALLRTADESVKDDEFTKHVKKLRSFETIKKESVSKTFHGALREYQKAGFDWLHFLKEYSFGGILADDMGLGKTIQVLALLDKIKSVKKSDPHLIIAPTSVVFNWMNESARFTPSLKILNHTGNERIKENHLHFENFDAVLTSYAILLRDFELFLARQFNYVVLDESQKIKNPTSKTGKLVRELKAQHRLCLTGTPLENNLNELWSQMAFVNPGLFGSLNKFQEAFVKPVQKENDKDSAEFLKRTIYPFLLRRTKEVVARELPAKTEIIHYCEMEPGQEEIYKVWKNSIREELLKEIAKKGIQKSSFKVIEGLLRLRQICNHPVLVKKNYSKGSGKLEEFKEMTEKVVGEGHKVLVFSQFVQMLDIIKMYLDAEKVKYEYLTGSTKNREECVNNFQNENDVKIFLISLKAGGFGLNLTAADYVFHYDPWWNPAVEKQATDRTHRIGQDKNVFVYKFITKNSVEEKILQLQDKKRKLVENIITSEAGVLKNLTREDIEVLFE